MSVPDPVPVVLVGALHVDELAWPVGEMTLHASNPVRRLRRPGGVAANVARALAAERGAAGGQTGGRTGGPTGGHTGGPGERGVTLIAALGDDADGRWLADSIAADGVDCRAPPLAGRASGAYTVVHDERGELLIGLADTAIAETLDAEAVRDALREVRAAALVLDANLDARCIAGLLDGGPIGRDGTAADLRRIALAVSPSKALRLASRLGSLDLLFCNRREAATLGGMDAAAPLGQLADALSRAGCRRFVLSDGAAPLLVRTPEANARIEVPPLAAGGSVNGAGDALAGATLARWLGGTELARAVAEAGLPAARRVIGAALGANRAEER